MAPPTVITNRIIATHTNDEVLGSDIQLSESHRSSLRDTEDYFKKTKTIQDFCNRLKKMIAWIKQNYPEYHRVGNIALSEEQKADKRRFHTQEEDFKYKGLNVNIVKAFMSGHKFKPGTQTQYGFIHMRKYHNAIQHGASRAGEPLPQAYVIEMPKILQSLKKEKIKRKKMAG